MSNNNIIITNYKMFQYLSNIIKSEILANNLQKKQDTPVSQQTKYLTHIIVPKEEIKQINT